MKKFALLLFLTAAIVSKSQSQDLPAGMTVLGIQGLVKSTLNDITNAGATLLGDGSIALGGASAQITGLMNQLNSMVQNDISTPIQNLSDQVKNLSNQLYSVCSRLNTILNQQQVCLLLNAQIVIASVQTIVSELKNGIPVISKDAPRLNYFQFAGHSPSIVPAGGGRVDIIGFKLWPSSSLPPAITIMDETEKDTIKVVTPMRSQNDNSVAFMLDSNTLIKYAGQTLEMKVDVKDKTWLLFSKSLGTWFLPMTIPSAFATQLQVAFHVQYTCQKDTTQVLDFRAFNFDNSSCGNKANVTHTEYWNIPNNGSILQAVYQANPDTRNDYNISVNPGGNGITAAGWIDNPTCVDLFLGQKLIHSSYWHASIAPKVTYKVADSYIVDGISPFINMETQETNILLNINSACANPTTVTYWFDIIKKSGTSVKTIYSSQRTTNGNFSDDFEGLSITTSFNPTPVNGQSQAVVKITQPQCGL